MDREQTRFIDGANGNYSAPTFQVFSLNAGQHFLEGSGGGGSDPYIIGGED